MIYGKEYKFKYRKPTILVSRILRLDTVGKYEKKIAEYILNQLKADSPSFELLW